MLSWSFHNSLFYSTFPFLAPQTYETYHRDMLETAALGQLKAKYLQVKFHNYNIQHNHRTFILPALIFKQMFSEYNQGGFLSYKEQIVKLLFIVKQSQVIP